MTNRFFDAWSAALQAERQPRCCWRKQAGQSAWWQSAVFTARRPDFIFQVTHAKQWSGSRCFIPLRAGCSGPDWLGVF